MTWEPYLRRKTGDHLVAPERHRVLDFEIKLPFLYIFATDKPEYVKLAGNTKCPHPDHLTPIRVVRRITWYVLRTSWFT